MDWKQREKRLREQQTVLTKPSSLSLVSDFQCKLLLFNSKQMLWDLSIQNKKM